MNFRSVEVVEMIGVADGVESNDVFFFGKCADMGEPLLFAPS